MEVLFIKAWVDMSGEALPNESRVVVAMEVVPNEISVDVSGGDLAQGGLINVGKNMKPDESRSDRSYRVSRFLPKI